jgi:hypothetical protein
LRVDGPETQKAAKGTKVMTADSEPEWSTRITRKKGTRVGQKVDGWWIADLKFEIRAIP